MMLTSDVPYSDPSHNHNAPSHGMQTHQSLFTKKILPKAGMEKLICLSNAVWWQSTCSYVDASVWRVDGVSQRGFVRVFGRVGGGQVDGGARVGR